jgi:hypothetical protein
MKTPLSERLTVSTSVNAELFVNEVQVASWVIDEVKELEKQNAMMLEALEKFTKIEWAMGKDPMVYGNTYVPEEWLQFLTIARDIITKVKGENQ